MLSFEWRGGVDGVIGDCVCCVFFSLGGELEMDWRMGEEGCDEFVGACWCW